MMYGITKLNGMQFISVPIRTNCNIFLADLQSRVLFAKRATDLGANIVSRTELRDKDLQLIIKAGIVCRDVGIGFVEERPATDTDIKTMLVVI